MEVLKDYPKEFAKLFRPSFNYLLKINMKFLPKDEGFIRKYWRYSYIIPCMAISYISLTWSFVKLVAEGEIHDITYLAPPFLVSTQASFKAIVLLGKSSLLLTIINDLGSLWRTRGLTNTQKNVRDCLLKRMTFCNGVTYWISTIGSTQYLTTALVETLMRRFILSQDCELLLPMKCSYPFDPTANWLVYLAVYGFQFYSMFLNVFVYVGTVLITITLCALLAIEFTLLCEDVLHIKPTIKNKRTKISVSTDNGTEWTLIDIVVRHQKLCALSKQLVEAFNQLIFIDLLFVGITTCFFRYAAQYSRGVTYRINNYVAVIFSLSNILYLCYFGELLTGASLRVGDMAYHSPWYEGDKRHQKFILNIIMRSQKPCCLTSMKYAPVTLNMFTKVMSNTWSYLSLMNYVYEDN